MSVATIRCYAAIGACYFAKIGVGLLSAYPSTALPDIASGRYGFLVGDSSMEAWFASLTRLAGFLTCLFIAPLMDGFGRKMTFIASAVVSAIGWLISAVAHDWITLFVGNVIVSLAAEAQTVVAAVCVAELTPKEIRGDAMSGNYGSLLVGVALSYILGTFINWRWLAVVCVGISLMQISCGWLLLPETPRWLLLHGFRDTASFNLGRLRRYMSGSKETLVDEIKEMEDSIRSSDKISFFSGLAVLVRTPLRRPLLISQLLVIFQQFSANGYIKTFTVTIFKMANPEGGSSGGVLGNPNYQTIIVGLCAVIGGILSMTSVDRLGRRICLIVSGSMVSSSLMFLGAYFWLHNAQLQWTNANLQWLPLLCLVIFEIGYGFGLGPIPYILMSELFPTKLRSTASAAATLTFSITLFIVVKISGSRYFAPYTLFWMFGTVSFVGLLFVIFFVPETKGRTLEGIEKIWSKEEKSKIDETQTKIELKSFAPSV